MNILFVCTANVSRSFLAEQLFRNEIRQAGLSGVEVASAGVADLTGSPPDAKMIEYLAKQQIPYTKHTARPVDSDLLGWADRVLVMEEAHAEFLREHYPRRTGKIEPLGRYVSPGEAPIDIADPFGLSTFYYRTAISQITLAVRNLVQSIAAGQ